MLTLAPCLQLLPLTLTHLQQPLTTHSLLQLPLHLVHLGLNLHGPAQHDLLLLPLLPTIIPPHQQFLHPIVTTQLIHLLHLHLARLLNVLRHKTQQMRFR